MMKEEREGGGYKRDGERKEGKTEKEIEDGGKI